MLTSLNQKPVASAGLVAGSASVLGAAAYLFSVLSDSDELLWLYEAAKTHTDPNHSVARLAGAGVGFIGAILLSLLAAYAGKPAKPFSGS